MNKEERIKAAEAYAQKLDKFANLDTHAFSNRDVNDIVSDTANKAFLAGAEAEAESKWVDADTAIVADGEVFLGCHHHDNWYSLIYKDNGKWFNEWDNDCECYPSHIMELPYMPYHTPPLNQQ